MDYIKNILIYKEINKIHIEGIDLALHSWIPAKIDAAIFYFHGLQSHAGWLWEVGTLFADSNIAFFVLDRRGSGISGGVRNEIANLETTIKDYVIAISLVKDLIGNEVPLSLFGHCLGGSFLGGLMNHPSFKISYDSAIFCSAWLGRMHAMLSENERLFLMQNNSKELWNAELESSDFTDISHYRDFIDQDKLAIRAITYASKKVLLGMEELYIHNSPYKFNQLPIAYISGETDAVINLTEAYHSFSKHIFNRHTKVSFVTDKHYLFFTTVKNEMINWIVNFILKSKV